MKKIIVFILFAFIYFTSCGNTSNNDNKEQESPETNIPNNNDSNEKETITVGGYVYDYPFLYHLPNGDIGGFDYDMLNEIARISDLKLEFIQKDFIDLIPGLLDKQVDIISAGISITEERKKLFNFSKKYYSSGQTLMVNKDNTDIKTIEDLKGKNIGVISGTISDDLVSAIEGVNVVGFDSTGSVLLSLKVEKIDGAVLDESTIINYLKLDDTLKSILGVTFPKTDYGYGIRKEDTELLEKINYGLDVVMTNGFYDQLIKKYF